MKKAVIISGGKQFLVSEGDTITVDKTSEDMKTLSFAPLLVIDGSKTTVGTPEVKGVKVSAKVVDHNASSVKTTSIRYKAKKRVHTVKGHRQHFSDIKITKIA